MLCDNPSWCVPRGHLETGSVTARAGENMHNQKMADIYCGIPVIRQISCCTLGSISKIVDSLRSLLCGNAVILTQVLLWGTCPFLEKLGEDATPIKRAQLRRIKSFLKIDTVRVYVDRAGRKRCAGGPTQGGCSQFFLLICIIGFRLKYLKPEDIRF